MVEIFIHNFILAFVLIDPIGIIPIFTALTVGMNASLCRIIALRALIVAFFVLVFFWMAGPLLFEAMGIGLDSFRIGGGLFLLFIAFEMIFEKRAPRRANTVKSALHDQNVSALAVFPLAIPLLAGPGAITITILQPGLTEVGFSSAHITGFCAIATVLLLAGLAMVFAASFADRLNVTVTVALQKLMGLLLGGLAVEFVLVGITERFALL